MSAQALCLPVAPIGVMYLARGADDDALAKFEAFRASYLRWPAGAEHALYVIYKGFHSAGFLARAREIFAELPHEGLYLDDDGLDLGAYFRAAGRVEHERLCFLNTASRILAANWLAKLAANLADDVGMVSCSGNFEAPQHPGRDNVPFPNAHLRTNGFLVRRKDLLAMRPVSGILDKMDAYMLEHGRESMTRRFWAKGLKTLVVGRNGRGYEPAGWSASATFRNGGQRNLLVADNQTGAYDEAPPSEKSALYKLSWDNFAIPDEAVVALAAQRQDAPSVRLPAWSPTRRSEKWAFLRRLVGLPEAGISAKQARATGLFNAKWYLQRYPDVQAAGVDPLQHFLSHGQWELRSPGPGFDSEAYLNAHPAIKKTVLSPFEYFVKNEWSETAVD